MPLFELQPTREGRFRVFARAQLPFLLATVLLAVVCAVVLPEHVWSPWFLSALAIILLGSILMIVAPWKRISSSWLIFIALADIVAVAFIRLELYDDVPGVGVLAVFPVLWLAYGFQPAVMFLGVAGSLFVTTFPYLLLGEMPPTPVAWLNALLLPACVAFMAVAVGTAARQLRRSRARVEQHAARLEGALQESQDAELIARAVFQTVDAAMAFYGVNNKPVIANEQAYEVVKALDFSLDKPPYAGYEVFEADRVTRIPLSEQIIPRALRGEEIAGHIEWLGPPGDQTAILASTKRVHREDGTVIGTFIAAFDITELANAVSVREQFLTTVSHELRTPLTSIMGYLELIDDTIDTRALEIDDYFRIVQRNAEQLLTRIAELLTFSEQGIVLEKKLTDLSELVGAVADKISPAADAARLSVVRDLPASLEVAVDAHRFEQIVDNLLSNAIKYTPTGGTITVGLSHDQTDAVLTVTDDGIGMSPEEQRQAFDRFFRSSTSYKGAVQGIGVGLSIVKEFVDAHGGEISLDSTLGEGTTVTVRLPLPAAGA